MLIVCDFDGTVTETDTLQHLCQRYAPETWGALDGKLASGELTLRDVIRHEVGSVRVPEEEVVAVVLEATGLRPGFVEFVDRVEAAGDRLVLVSAGMRQLIEPLLEHNGIARDRLTLLANDAEFGPDGATVTFREVEQCGSCGQHCKRGDLAVIRSPQDERVVYVGDGFSDRCGAEAADRIFARDSLATYLDDEGVDYTWFDDFHVIARELYGRNGNGQARSDSS